MVSFLCPAAWHYTDKTTAAAQGYTFCAIFCAPAADGACGAPRRRINSAAAPPFVAENRAHARVDRTRRTRARSETEYARTSHIISRFPPAHKTLVRRCARNGGSNPVAPLRTVNAARPATARQHPHSRPAPAVSQNKKQNRQTAKNAVYRFYSIVEVPFQLNIGASARTEQIIRMPFS